ncbi:MAG: transcription termination/antitermination protein NusA [Flavobacteriales bacterium]|nr:transcription termination/antitermination protein NusA [Flavobacteriales bacterium]|tara:strand:- start:321 stop:1556 length:1236 start_codon:yes stop_codon:yes gene_type:complete
MDTSAIIDSFIEFKDDKNIDRITLMGLLEQSFRALLIKQYGSDENFDIVVNANKGDLQIFHNKIVVEDEKVVDINSEISLSDALKIEDDFEIGDEVAIEKKIVDFGRRAIQTLKQNLISKVLEHDYDIIHKSYKDRVNEIISGDVHHIRHREIILIDENDTELILPRDEQIPSDFFRKGDTVRAVIKDVLFNKGKPRIVISRTSPAFLERLFELEIPEIADGLIVVKDVKRVPGEKAKVSVESYDERIDPVGACVGMKGSRIHSIVRELGNENIDVINYTDNLKLFISRSLSPAKITSININEETNKVDVYLKPDQVSLAIGKGGFNIRLAGQLTGYEIDVYRDIDEDEDVALSEFADEIDQWIIDVFKSIGCDTAKSVLELGVEELSRRTDLEEETISEVQNILRLEFEE